MIINMHTSLSGLKMVHYFNVLLFSSITLMVRTYAVFKTPSHLCSEGEGRAVCMRRSEDNLEESELPFHLSVGPRDGTQVFELGGKSLCPLSHPVSLREYLELLCKREKSLSSLITAG